MLLWNDWKTRKTTTEVLGNQGNKKISRPRDKIHKQLLEENDVNTKTHILTHISNSYTKRPKLFSKFKIQVQISYIWISKR